MKQLSGKLSIEPILELIRSDKPYAYVEGIRVKVGGVRLETFATKGVDCVSCSLKGEFFRVEDNTSGAHLNLYAINPYGHEVLMTRDHIIPRSQKGPDTVDNMNTMCTHCNGRRGIQPLEQFLQNNKGVYKPSVIELHEYKSFVATYIKSHGTDNKVIRMLSGQDSHSKLWKITNLIDNTNDEDSITLLEGFRDSSKKRRSKIGIWIREEYNLTIKNHGGEVPDTIKSHALLGVMLASVRRYIHHPNDTNFTSLENTYNKVMSEKHTSE